MKKSCIVNCLAVLLLIATLTTACADGGKKEAVVHQQHLEQVYTCSMHPAVSSNKPGKCPICGMDLVTKEMAAMEENVDSTVGHLVKPVNEQVVTKTATTRPESSIRILSVQVHGSISYDTRNQTSISSRVAGRIERLLVKYNYQPVRQGQLIMELYSPDLAAAQRELLFIYQSDRNNNNLLQKARQRLSLLGMQEGMINQVLRTGKIVYRMPVYSNVSGYILEKTSGTIQNIAGAGLPSATASNGEMTSMNSGVSAGQTTADAASTATPVMLREGQYVGAGQSLFTIYKNNGVAAEFSFEPGLAASIKRGQRLLFFQTADPETVYTGTIGLIQPTIKAGNRFTTARVYVSDSRLQVGQLVTANVPVLNKGWWVPQTAVLFLGNRSVVFKKEGDVFVPKTVQAKIKAEGMVLVESGISPDWDIAKNASYMVDSESFIKLDSTSQSSLEK